MTRLATLDSTKLDHVIGVLESLHQHRIAKPLNKSDELYYEMLVNYYHNIRDAKAQGKTLVYHTAQLPTEIFYAMDLVPCLIDMAATTVVNLINAWEEGLATAKAYGLAPEICSSQRLIVSNVINGWLPRPDAVIWSNMTCDNCAAMCRIAARLWGCPGHYLDRGYQFDERGLAYYKRELEGMIAFLEALTGRKMDWDRLSEAVAYGRELMVLEREIEELRKATPSPLRSRAGLFMHLVGYYLPGTPESVTFMRQMRDEAKARVANGEGSTREEKYRLLMFFEPPAYGWKLLDWMERAHNAVIVAEPSLTQWGPGDLDPARPLESLALKAFIQPGSRQGCGPIDSLVEDMLHGVKEYKVDGVIAFTHVGCRQAASCNRLLKDTIAAETGLPFFSVEHDIADPAFASEEEIRDKIEGFLEMIDERRG